MSGPNQAHVAHSGAVFSCFVVGSFLSQGVVAAASGDMTSASSKSISFLSQSRQPDTTAARHIEVWVHAYPRSGSSTVLSMVNAASQQTGDVFSIFEPCHKEDIISPELKQTRGPFGCEGVMRALAHCDFNGIYGLSHWGNRHTIASGVEDYEPKAASKACRHAHVSAFKTVDYAHDMHQDGALELLAQAPNLRVLDDVRDPRGIYASLVRTKPFSMFVNRSVDTLTDICVNLAANLQINHPRIHRVVYDDLVQNPESTVRETYSFLGLKFGHTQEEWIKKNFNADCVDPTDAYADCRHDSTWTSKKWQRVLTDDEKMAFNSNPACQKVAAHYGFETVLSSDESDTM